MKKTGSATKTRKAPAKTPAPAPHPGIAEDMKYKAQDALHTLRRAEEIKADPQLMAHVKNHAKEQRDHLNRVIRRK
jgi:hypothetical protein